MTEKVQKSGKKKWSARLKFAAAGLILLAAAGGLQLAARNWNGFGEWYATTVYPWIVEIYGRICGIFLFSVVEIALYALILWVILGMTYRIGKIFYAAAAGRKERNALISDAPRSGRKERREPVSDASGSGGKERSEPVSDASDSGGKERREPVSDAPGSGRRIGSVRGMVYETAGAWFSHVLFAAGLLAFLYTACCGVNYYRRPFSDYLNLEVRNSSVDELYRLCEYLVERVNGTVDNASYDASWASEGKRAMERLAERYPQLEGYYPRPKGLIISRILSVQQTSGVYSPFTVEANYNKEMTAYDIPHTICHELSHLRGFMREDEANFIGYLACIGSDSRSFQYSGYLTGWVYAGNALAAQDAEAFRELYGRLDPQAVSDLHENNAFWARYEGKVAEVSNQVNDVYLKINDQQDGVKSYGRMVDLMLAYYRE